MRLFVSDVVGMLRYKQPLITSLGDTITANLASLKTARDTYQQRAQEAELRRIKEVCAAKLSYLMCGSPVI